MAKPFVKMQKVNISSRFVSQDVVSSFSIFDLKKVPDADSSDLLQYREDSVNLLLAHYGTELPADTCTVNGDEYTRNLSDILIFEWSGKPFEATY